MSTCACRPVTLHQLQRRFDRLRQLQNRLRLRAANHFDAHGRRYCLPLRAVDAQPSKQVPPRVLCYLAGFFDGDGCVGIRHKHSGIRLSVSQTESSSEVLLLFRNMFGGFIGRGEHACGLRRPSLRWELSGEAGRQAAALLSDGTLCKRPQLALAISWPQEPSLRAEAAANMKLLKQEAPTEATCLSWRYLAGFFDAEGCIVLRPPGSLRLELKQKFLPVLHSIQSFLANHGVGCTVHDRQSHGVLVVHKTESCKFVLGNLIRSGLRVKREAARLVMQEVSAAGFIKARRDLQKMIGNQGRYQRLSICGLARAEEIRRIQGRLRYLARRQHSDSELVSELLALQEDHKLKCGQERLRRIRSDIRSFMLEGARS